MKYQSKTPEEIKKIAMDIHQNLIFTDRHVENPNDLGMVFMPLVFGLPMSDEEVKEIGMIYEYMTKSSSRSINGYPCFGSFSFLNKEDSKLVMEKLKEISEALKAI